MYVLLPTAGAVHMLPPPLLLSRCRLSTTGWSGGKKRRAKPKQRKQQKRNEKNWKGKPDGSTQHGLIGKKDSAAWKWSSGKADGNGTAE
jgi:hypothetical protein